MLKKLKQQLQAGLAVMALMAPAGSNAQAQGDTPAETATPKLSKAEKRKQAAQKRKQRAKQRKERAAKHRKTKAQKNNTTRNAQTATEQSLPPEPVAAEPVNKIAPIQETTKSVEAPLVVTPQPVVGAEKPMQAEATPEPKVEPEKKEEAPKKEEKSFLAKIFGGNDEKAKAPETATKEPEDKKEKSGSVFDKLTIRVGSLNAYSSTGDYVPVPDMQALPWLPVVKAPYDPKAGGAAAGLTVGIDYNGFYTPKEQRDWTSDFSVTAAYKIVSGKITGGEEKQSGMSLSLAWMPQLAEGLRAGAFIGTDSTRNGPLINLAAGARADYDFSKILKIDTPLGLSLTGNIPLSKQDRWAAGLSIFLHPITREDKKPTPARPEGQIGNGQTLAPKAF